MLCVSTEGGVNTREGGELLKLDDNGDTRKSGYELAMNATTLEVQGGFQPPEQSGSGRVVHKVWQDKSPSFFFNDLPKKWARTHARTGKKQVRNYKVGFFFFFNC